MDNNIKKDQLLNKLVELQKKILRLEKLNKINGERLKKLEYEKNFLNNLIQVSPAFIVAIDKTGKTIFMNKTMLKNLGYNEEEVKGKDYLSTFVPEDERSKLSKVFKNLVDEEKPTINENYVLSKDGKKLLVKWHGIPILEKETEGFDYFVGIGIDITQVKKSEEALIKSEKRYRSLFENSIDGIYISTLDGKYIDANPALVKILGYASKDELLSINTKQLYVSEKNRPSPEQRNRTFETQLKKKDGTRIWVEISSRVIHNGGKPLCYQGIVRDITERKKSEEKIKYLSFHDNLTDLYNRAYFDEELRRLNTKRQLPLSIIMGDLNGLKLVNNAFGYREGDRLLKKIAKVLKKCCREEDIVARWGGDEFSILLPKTTEKDALEIIDRIKETCKKVSDQKIPLSISLGVSAKSSPDQNIEDAIKEAEDRMQRRKLIERKSISGSIISSLERTLLEKSYETEKHAERLKRMAVKLGKTINLPQNKLDELILLSSLHDIGKVTISEEILNKKDKLTKKEWKVIKKHPEAGYSITRASPLLSHIADAVLYHHEWWDGSGYPHGLKGKDIPITSRIIAIVDAYDVMRSGRAYKKPKSKNEAVEELKRCSGIQFDPELVDKFIQILEEENSFDF